jgi:hypothetical protein
MDSFTFVAKLVKEWSTLSPEAFVRNKKTITPPTWHHPLSPSNYYQI